jgi:hypothetical protein
MISLLLDSGAYSAFTRNKAIDRVAYNRFILENEECFTAAINLDVINPKDPDAAAAEGWLNLLYAREQGVNAIPVFHARENVSWLQRMIDTTGYIGLSGTSLVSPTEHRSWYGLAWDYCTDIHGRPIADFHAFGDAAPESLATYPWYSADCATAQLSAGLGGTVILEHTRFQMKTHMRRPNAAIIDDDNPLARAEFIRRGIDFDRFVHATDLTQTEIIMIKFYLNCVFLLELADSYAGVTTYKRGRLFDTRPDIGISGTERKGGLKLYFVISDSMFKWGFPVFAMLGIQNLLISYFYCAPTRFPELKEFLTNPIEVASRSKYWPALQRMLCTPHPSFKP